MFFEWHFEIVPYISQSAEYVKLRSPLHTVCGSWATRKRANILVLIPAVRIHTAPGKQSEQYRTVRTGNITLSS